MTMFSLITTTLNRSEELKKLILSLEKSTLQDFELIVVDQSNDFHHEINKNSLSNSSLDAVLIRDSEKGLSRGRNIGLQRASGSVFCFPDDDCEYPERLLETVSTIFSEKSCAIICGTYIDQVTGETAHKGLVEHIANYHGFSIDNICSVGLFFHSERINRDLIWFDQNLGAGTELPSAEEMDLAIRCIKSGYTIFFTPNVFVFHPVVRSNVSGKNALKRHSASAYVMTKNFFYYPVATKLILGILKDSFLIILFRRNLFFRLKGIYFAIVNNPDV